MRGNEYERICYMTEQQDEHVQLINMKTGERGCSLGCTIEGNTVQVRLENGELDSWDGDNCQMLVQ